MNKKIIISLSVIGAIAAIAIGGTMAYFSDTETSTGNTFTAGTLDLRLDNGDTNVTKFTVTDANPGQFGWGTWKVENDGNLPGYLDLQNITFADDDMDCTEPESSASDSTCGPTGGGELSANMDVVLFVDTNNNHIEDGDETEIYSGKLNDIASDYGNLNLLLAASGGADTNYITMTWSVDTTVGNIIQSDKTTLGINFELQQRAED
jgi:spore coat-associated protein N